MVEELALLGQRLQELADATEATKGEMTLPGIDITAPANQEAKSDAKWGNPATFETPVQSALAHLELLFHAANDHLRSLGRLLSTEHISWFGHIAVARAVVETSSRLWYLAEPNIGPLERVRRHLLEIQYEYSQRGGMLGQHFTDLPAPLLAQAQQSVSSMQQRITTFAAAVQLPLNNGGVLVNDRPRPMDLLVALFRADPAAPAIGAAALAAYNYNRLSAVAHGQPSGVSIYHKPPATPDGHAHNVLEGEDVAQIVLPALTAYNAGYERLALYFRWEHRDLLPIQWAAINAMNVFMPNP